MKLFLGEKRVEAVLERLDLLTRDEVRMSAVQTLEAVYGLVQSMRLFMAGEQKQPNFNHWQLTILPHRWQDIC
jgi:hypothetical protein